MWKYECKKHLIYTLIATVAGAILFGVFGFGKEAILLALQSVEETTGMAANEYAYFVENSLYLALFGAFYIGGFVNGLLLVFALNRRFQLNYIIILALFLLGGDLILLAGSLLLIPTIIVCLYGMLTIPNRKERSKLKEAQISSTDELKRNFELHYTMDAYGEKVGKEAAGNIIKIAILNALAIGIYFMVIVYVASTMVVLVAGAILMMLLFLINQMHAKAMAPVVNLLYDQCQPQACASAIFAIAKKLHRKKSLPLAIQFAESMLYLNDPHLCIDALSMQKMQKGHAFITYHTLMAEAYYLLGDQMMVKSHYEQVEEMKEHSAINPLLVQQVLETIQNRLHMMNQDFESVRRYYSKYQAAMRKKVQMIELHYHLGLLAFIDRDFTLAKSHLEKVVEFGGTTYFVEKAQKLVNTLNQIQ